MTSKIHDILQESNLSLLSRAKAVQQLKVIPAVEKELLFFMFEQPKEVGVIASVLLDDLATYNHQLLDNYIDYFIEALPKVRNESIKRLCSKLCILLVEKRKAILSTSNEEQLMNQCLEWLTQEAKVATEANAMQIIMRLANKFPTQAKLIAELIEVRYSEKSVAYQNRAKKLLKQVQHLS